MSLINFLKTMYNDVNKIFTDSFKRHTVYIIKNI